MYYKHDYGTYLFGDFTLGKHPGANVLSAYWYNRNLRIFRKLQEITENPNDCILLILETPMPPYFGNF